MLEYFPERRKSSTDLLPLPKAVFFRRSPSPAKRSFSDLLNPFQKRSNDDTLFFIEKQEPFPKRPVKNALLTKNKTSNNRNITESINEILQSYPNKAVDNSTENNSYSFIDALSTEMPAEMLHRHSTKCNDESEISSEKSLVIWELITSEIVYLKQIYFIINTPIPILIDIKDQFFPKIDVFSVFGNLYDVFKSNVTFWLDFMEDVYQCLKLNNETPKLEKMISGFISFSKHFVPYKSYCMNISSNIEYIAKLEAESENFKQFLKWCRNSDSSNRLGLDTFITMPFQRLTRYSLFLERILKECSDQREIQQLMSSIAEVDKFVNNINKSIKIKELTSKLHYFQTMICGFPTIEEYTKAKFPIPPYPVFNLSCSMQVKSEYESEVRCLLHQDTFRLKQMHRKTLSVKVLLFTDLLIFAKPIKKNQQCRLQLIGHPMILDQLIIYDSLASTDNDQSLFMAELNSFACYSNIFKLSNDKRSTCQHSLTLFMKKFNTAKTHYEAIMLHQRQSNVHISVVNSDNISLHKITKHREVHNTLPKLDEISWKIVNPGYLSSLQGKDYEICNENPTNHQSPSSSVSENESDNEYVDYSTKSLSSSSWTDLENNLNSCIINDPFINYFDNTDSADGSSHRTTYRSLLQNNTDKFGKRKHDSVQSFSGEGSTIKADGTINIFRRSSLGNKHVIQTNLEND